MKTNSFSNKPSSQLVSANNQNTELCTLSKQVIINSIGQCVLFALFETFNMAPSADILSMAFSIATDSAVLGKLFSAVCGQSVSTMKKNANDFGILDYFQHSYQRLHC